MATGMRSAALWVWRAWIGEPEAQGARRPAGEDRRQIPRDLRHAVLEVSGQPGQLGRLHRALARVRAPVHVVHGDRDDFAPIEIAEALAASVPTRRPIRFQRVAGANHFLNDGPVEPLLAVLEACIPARRPWLASRLPQWLRPAWLRLGPWETHARA